MSTSEQDQAGKEFEGTKPEAEHHMLWSSDEQLDAAAGQVVIAAEWLAIEICGRLSDERNTALALRLLNSTAKTLARVANMQEAIVRLKVADGERYRKTAIDAFEAAQARLEKARENIQHTKRPRRRKFPQRLSGFTQRQKRQPD